MQTSSRRVPEQPSEPGGASGGSGGERLIAVWLRVKSARRPQRMAVYLNELAEPDFTLDACRESAPPGVAAGGYRAHWYCRFARAARDEFAALRLLKRLTGAGFDVLHYDAASPDDVQAPTLSAPDRETPV